MRRILNWFFDGKGELPAYYAEQGYSAENLRLYSIAGPGKACKVDIRDDGVSILEQYAQLSGQQNLEELAGNFKDGGIDEGSVITCHIVDTGGMATLSIQLELEASEG